MFSKHVLVPIQVMTYAEMDALIYYTKFMV